MSLHACGNTHVWPVSGRRGAGSTYAGTCVGSNALWGEDPVKLSFAVSLESTVAVAGSFTFPQAWRGADVV